MFCNLCSQHARHPKSPVPDLRRKPCPRFPLDGQGEAGLGVVHRGCCAQEPCSGIDGRGHVRCMWEQGGRERLAEAEARKSASDGPRAPGRA